MEDTNNNNNNTNTPTYRPPQEFNVEEVLDNTTISPRMLNSFLHENYLNFFTDIHNIAEGASYLSDSDIISGPIYVSNSIPLLVDTNSM